MAADGGDVRERLEKPERYAGTPPHDTGWRPYIPHNVTNNMFPCPQARRRVPAGYRPSDLLPLGLDADGAVGGFRMAGHFNGRPFEYRTILFRFLMVDI